MKGVHIRQVKVETALIILSIFIFTHLLYLYQYQTWLNLLNEFSTLVITSIEGFFSLQLKGVLIAFFAWIWILLVGSIVTELFLPQKPNNITRFATAIALGLGIAGTLTLVLGVFHVLQWRNLVLSMVSLIGLLLYVLFRDTSRRHSSLKKLVVKILTFWLAKPTKYTMIVLPSVATIYYFIISYAILAPVVHWDATVYHALMANVLYLYGGFPLITGTSHGLEMSSNYPPLFSALGAFFYVLIGSIEDTYLKIISPIAGLITLVAVYGIGRSVVDDLYGALSSLILLSTPLFILYSIYATSYGLYVAFVSFSVFYLILALREPHRNYWLIAGILYGFALLTNYQALFFLPLYGVVIIYMWIKGQYRHMPYLILPIILIGSIWFLRNAILIGDPIYPFGFLKKSEPSWLRDFVFASIEKSAIVSFFNKYNPTPIDYVGQILFNRVHYPAYSLLLVVSIPLALLRRNSNFYVLIAWPTTVLIPIVTGVHWIFPRSFLATIPGFSILTALPLYEVVTVIRQSGVKYSRIFTLTFLTFIVVSLTLFPALPTAIAGKNIHDASSASPPSSVASILNEKIPEWYHGQHRSVWEFLNSHLKEGERVATLESKLYYIKNGDPRYFFPLDGSEASTLYMLTSPEEIIDFLKSKNVRYIYDSPWTRGAIWEMIPLTRFLGSPWFPAVYAVNPTIVAKDTPTLYNVGPLPNTIIESEGIPASLNIQGWVQKMIGDTTVIVAISEKEDAILSDAPRIYVATQTAVLIRFTYLDYGKDWVDIHLYGPTIKEWIYSYVKVPREDTGIWRTFEFVVPPDRLGYVVLGIHAYKTNFTIRSIVIEPLKIIGRYSLQNIERTFTNTTNPPTLMVYLPSLGGGEKVIVETSSYGKNVSLEIFEGVIQPWETTQWWNNHIMVARVPDLPTFGIQDPTLIWNAKPGIYTLVIVLWDNYTPDTRIDLSIIIVSSSYEV